MNIDYTLKRSGRRTLAVEITPQGEVLVRAPMRLSPQAIQEFVCSRENWIRKHQAAQRARAEAFVEPGPEEAAFLRAAAQAYLPGRVEYFAGRMNLWPASVKITSARTRFGSCSSKNGLCFSWRLMLYPPDAIDYVVVHELAHIRHKDHSAAFYRTIAQWLPDYQRRRRLLQAPPCAGQSNFGKGTQP